MVLVPIQQQGRKDNNFVCISSYDGLVLNFPRVERVLVQIWQHISKIQSGIYPFVVNTFGWIGDGLAVEIFANWSAISFPGMFWWPGTQRKGTSYPDAESVE